MSPSVLKNLKQYFGYDSLRPSQIPVISSILANQDTLAIMPTGGGKSICYQLPSTLLSGLTIVVSPLIALMHDQVESLSKNGINAMYYNSSQSTEEQAEVRGILNEMEKYGHTNWEGSIKMLYTSPERLLANDAQFLNYLKKVPVCLFAIDEAHCVSSWGHDFRPEYSQLGKVKDLFPTIPIIALTATADELTRSDILVKLNLVNPKTFISSFDRPNIHYRVEAKADAYTQLEEFISGFKGQAGIIYCLSRKSTEEVAIKLTKMGIKALPYHASIDGSLKQKAYKQFMDDKVQVIVATIAFGMGIDKPNVRFVIHWNLPKNIESYYQETGRAGRDGLPSEALLLYNAGDSATLRKFIDNGGTAGPMISIKDRDMFRSIQHDKLDRLLEFCQTGHCRRRVLLQYFRESMIKDCGNCDRCTNPPAKIDGTELAQKIMSAIYRTDQRYGVGYIVDILLGVSNDRMVKNGHINLPTFGIGKDLEKQEWMNYVNQLIDLGLVDIKYDGFIKTLSLNEKSKIVLTGGGNTDLVEYKAKIATPAKAKDKKHKDILSADQQIVFNKLRELRKEIATREDVPAFVIFGDAALVDMAQSMPKNKKEFAEISGVGKLKLEKYADEFLEVIIF
ncbi:MAG: DNA helicase RecQ [candidate division SR1 bacterium]|nr:DNA helicase RecQ [candidate division SR1 bacterium]